jgi:uncharacterized damage-inducible protein DinB
VSTAASARREGLVGEAIRQARGARKQLYAYVEGLEAADFRFRPAPGANPILWLVWHVAEVEDVVASVLEGKRPEFPLGRSALKARGSDDLPDTERVLRYLFDVRERFMPRLQAFPDDALGVELGEGVWRGRGQSLIFLPSRHETYHLGQIGYVRRLIGKPVPDLNEGNPYQ